ncbi:MAG: hypothetical protein QOF51_4263 [Chloroflexota bacterium]|jgi:uncharacterized protein (DUF1015 family)|nr:hypothetical protein [Chloroflexota bacterium]
MADIRPIRGLRYNAARFGRDISSLVCPPFDVISPAEQSQLYERHPKNAIRLELTRQGPGDAPDARYQQAAVDFAAWRDEGTLVEESAPALYAYAEEFDGGRRVRRGLIAAMCLEPWERRIVLPHERTLSAAKADRMALMQACMANFSPIWGLYRDADGVTGQLWASIGDRAPDEEAVDGEGVRHRVWAVTDTGLAAQFHEALDDAPVYIADGHHRYTTALIFRDELRQQANTWDADAAPNFVLTYLVEGSDPGLVVLGTHRLIKAPSGVDEATVRKTLAEDFELQDVEGGPTGLLARLEQLPEGPAFAVWAPSHGMSLIARLRDPQGVPESVAEGHSAAWRRLDLAALHSVAIDRLFPEGTTELSESGRLTYPRSISELDKAVATGAADLAFLLRATPVGQIMAVADAGDLMPEKATFFYPKPQSGMVIASLRGSVPLPT